MGNNCGLEFQLLDLDTLIEPSSTPEPLLDLSFFPESVFVPRTSDVQVNHSIFSHSILGQGDWKIDSEINYKIWKLDGVKFLIKNVHIYIILVGYVKEISGGFLRTPRKFDWAAFSDQSDHHRNHHIKVVFSFPVFFFMHQCINSYNEDNAWDRCGGGF